MSTEFDRDTAVQADGPQRYSAEISANWNITTVPNGGYLMAVAARALSQHLTHPDPFSITGHFLKPIKPGPVSIAVETLKTGRAISFGQARVLQDGEERLRVTGAFGDLSQRAGLNHMARKPPNIPPFDACVRATIPLEFFRHVRIALTPESGAWIRGDYDDTCEVAGWTSFIDGREPDALSLILFADGFPPPVFRKVGPAGWVPTLEMTVQVRAHPAPGPLRCRFTTRAITEGYAEEDGEIWDAEGNLVAICRQLEAIRLPK